MIRDTAFIAGLFFVHEITYVSCQVSQTCNFADLSTIIKNVESSCCPSGGTLMQPDCTLPVQIQYELCSPSIYLLDVFILLKSNNELV
jgi:hypothetical protein